MAPAIGARERSVLERWIAEAGAFPHWTRDDDSEDEASISAEGRTRKGRRASKKRQDVSNDASGSGDVFVRSPPPVGDSFATELAEVVPPVSSSGEDSGLDSVESGIDSVDEATSVPAGAASTSPAVAPTTSLPSPPATTTAGAATDIATSVDPPAVTSPGFTISGQAPVETTLRPNPEFTTLPTNPQTTSLTQAAPETTSSPASGPSSSTTSVSSLPPSFTESFPPLSTGHKKEFSPPPHQLPPPPPRYSALTSTASGADATAEAEKAEFFRHEHDGINADTAKALISVGSIGGTIILAAIVWFIWRSVKRSRERQSSSWTSRPPSLEQFNKPSRRVRVLAHVPFLKNRVGTQGWSTIDEPYTELAHEKGQPQTSGASVPRIDSFFAPQKPASTEVPAAYIARNSTQATPAHAHNQSVSSTEAQHNNTMPLGHRYANRHVSEISSLSSGFGDGDIVLGPNGTGTYSTTNQQFASDLRPPPRIRQRETVYTEASEDAAPRFRTVNSWVRQQTGRVRRAVALGGPEPEPEFGMMMPDGEEPRRAEYGVAK